MLQLCARAGLQIDMKFKETMELIDDLIKVMALPEEQRESLVQAIVGLCKGSQPPHPYYFVPMKEEITSDADKAKEYFRLTQGEIPAWLYASINWKQAYTKLCQEGLLISSSSGTLMKLKASKY